MLGVFWIGMYYYYPLYILIKQQPKYQYISVLDIFLDKLLYLHFIFHSYYINYCMKKYYINYIKFKGEKKKFLYIYKKHIIRQ